MEEDELTGGEGEAANPDGVVHDADLAGARGAEGVMAEGEGKEAGEIAEGASSPSGNGAGEIAEGASSPSGNGAGEIAEGASAAELNDGKAHSSVGNSEDSAAAEALAQEYRGLSGVVSALIGGNTVAEVKTSLEASRKAYAEVRAELLKEQGVAVPSANGGSGVSGVGAAPATPFGMIVAGIAAGSPQRGGSK